MIQLKSNEKYKEEIDEFNVSIRPGNKAIHVCYTWKNIKKSKKSNKSPLSNEKLEVPNGSYFFSNN